MVHTQNDSEPVDPRIDLVGMDRDDLKGVTDALGESAYRSRQLYQWIYQRGVTDFAEMYNLSKTTRAKLDETYRIEPENGCLASPMAILQKPSLSQKNRAARCVSRARSAAL